MRMTQNEGVTKVTMRGHYFIAVFTFHEDVFIDEL